VGERGSAAEAGATIQDWIEEGKLSAGMAEPCLPCRIRNCACAMRSAAARGGLTVRQIERLAARRSRGNQAAAEVHVDANIKSALEELQRHLGTKVLLREKTKMRRAVGRGILR